VKQEFLLDSLLLNLSVIVSTELHQLASHFSARVGGEKGRWSFNQELLGVRRTFVEADNRRSRHSSTYY
jgi:hypothetical protein